MGIDPGYLTAAVAALATGITFAQWHTARTKLVLDLFEKRLAVYDELVKALEPIWDNGIPTEDEIAAFSQAQDRARFLYGDDVVAYLGELKRALNNLGLARSKMPMQVEHDNWENLALNSRLKLKGFYKEFGEIAEPYMRIDAKLPRWRFWESR